MSHTLIIGMGKSGLSVARHLARQGIPFRAADSRGDFGLHKSWQSEFPTCLCTLGPLQADLLTDVREVVVSPGVPLTGVWFDAAQVQGIPVRGDIDLSLHIAQATDIPTVLITGANGKSTVTALVGSLVNALGLRVGVGGNFGTPALDLLMQPVDVLVLEVSSFQLESTHFGDLTPTAALVLNISQDHLDRHGTIEHYAAIKERVLHRAQQAVINRDDALVSAMAENAGGHKVTFGQDAPVSADDFGLRPVAGQTWLVRGATPIFPVAELGIKGVHNQMNALAALALLQGLLPDLDLTDPRLTAVLRSFTGLPHRAQLVGTVGGIRFVDDSKATNVGAAVAAIRGMDGPLVLIAGGQGKGQDFGPLVDALRGKCVGLVLIGVDREAIATAVSSVGDDLFPIQRAETMAEAVALAEALAEAPAEVLAAQFVPVVATVLLAPACASLDMFESYADRGQQFAHAVAARATHCAESTVRGVAR